MSDDHVCVCMCFRAAMATAPYNYSYIFKYIIIGEWISSSEAFGCVSSGSHVCSLSTGDMGVGKSCLLHQFTEKKCEYERLSGLSLSMLNTHDADQHPEPHKRALCYKQTASVCVSHSHSVCVKWSAPDGLFKGVVTRLLFIYCYLYCFFASSLCVSNCQNETLLILYRHHHQQIEWWYGLYVGLLMVQ